MNMWLFARQESNTDKIKECIKDKFKEDEKLLIRIDITKDMNDMNEMNEMNILTKIVIQISVIILEITMIRLKLQEETYVLKIVKQIGKIS
jgi:hypothetical protein